MAPEEEDARSLARSLQEQLAAARSENLQLTQRLLVADGALAMRQRQSQGDELASRQSNGEAAPPLEVANSDTPPQPWRRVSEQVLVQALAQAEQELAGGKARLVEKPMLRFKLEPGRGGGVAGEKLGEELREEPEGEEELEGEEPEAEEPAPGKVARSSKEVEEEDTLAAAVLVQVIAHAG